MNINVIALHQNRIISVSVLVSIILHSILFLDQRINQKIGSNGRPYVFSVALTHPGTKHTPNTTDPAQPSEPETSTKQTSNTETTKKTSLHQPEHNATDANQINNKNMHGLVTPNPDNATKTVNNSHFKKERSVNPVKPLESTIRTRKEENTQLEQLNRLNVKKPLIPTETTANLPLPEESNIKPVQESNNPPVMGNPVRYKTGSEKNPEPSYPSIARSRGWQGDVILGVNVAADGSIKDILIVKGSGYSVLDYEAWETVRNKWTFDPIETGTQQNFSYIEIPISFRIQ